MTKYCWLFLLAMLVAHAGQAQANQQTAAESPAEWSDANGFFLDFSAVLKSANGVRLRWKPSQAAEGDYFVVERSTDGSLYETVSAIKVTDTVTGYEITDNSSLNGSFLYRIKYISRSGKYIYSKSLPVSFSADLDFRFYPNPVDKLLIIRTGHLIDIEVVDGAGTVRLNRQLPSGLQVINVSALEKGIYVLKIADKDSNRVVSEQLVKN